MALLITSITSLGYIKLDVMYVLQSCQNFEAWKFYLMNDEL